MNLFIIFTIIIAITIIALFITLSPKNKEKYEMEERIKKRIQTLTKENKTSNTSGNKYKKKQNPLEEVEKKIIQEKQKSQDFNQKFNQVSKLMKEAKSLEKSDIYHSIRLYEECMKIKAGNFWPEERLVILYKKTKQLEKELRMCEIMVGKINDQNLKRLDSALKNDPNKFQEIKSAWLTHSSYVGSDGKVRSCSISNDKYNDRIYQIIEQM